MVINYNVNKIRAFLRDFYNITGLTISIWDAEINQLAYQPGVMVDYCRLIKSSPIGNKRCLISDREACVNCKKQMSAMTHRCHAGLTDTAIPLVLNDTLFGFMMFGQAKSDEDAPMTYADVEKLAGELKLPADELYSAYKRLKTFEPEIISSAANILRSAAGYLFESYSIQYTANELVSNIDRWISENIKSSISIADICAQFGIAKNRLYSLWKTWFGVTIGKYILDKRMKMAKKLLANSDKRINEICIDVGIPDYNYFSKVYKKYYGLSPKQYRKNIPAILGNENN